MIFADNTEYNRIVVLGALYRERTMHVMLMYSCSKGDGKRDAMDACWSIAAGLMD